MGLSRALRLLEKLEQRMADLYAWYGEVFQDDDEAAAFFGKMAQDVRKHRDIVLFEQKLLTSDPSMFENVQIDCDELAQMIGVVDAERNAGTPTMDEAIVVALRMENLVAERRYRSAMERASQDISRLVRSMGESDDQHVEAIKEFAGRKRAPP